MGMQGCGDPSAIWPKTCFSDRGLSPDMGRMSEFMSRLQAGFQLGRHRVCLCPPTPGDALRGGLRGRVPHYLPGGRGAWTAAAFGHLPLGASSALSGLAALPGNLDLRWAFDVARLSSMKVACHEAGVFGTDWLLLDDVHDVDRQCVQLHGFLSDNFRLGCGNAQGRCLQQFARLAPG